MPLFNDHFQNYKPYFILIFKTLFAFRTIYLYIRDSNNLTL